ncbi:MAG: cupin domain-containing protein [Elusimicrobiota bacterium]
MLVTKSKKQGAESVWPASALVPLEANFTDKRGVIQPLVETLFRSAMVIYSKQGAVRGNHSHGTDWHYCYMLSGSMEYYYRPSGDPKSPEVLIVKAGQMIFTPPGVDHAMKFLEDTVWLTLSRNPRNQRDYEADLTRIQMV